jgi:hypothetical protein
MSILSIIDVREATPQEWDETWGECAYATFFQSREWFEIWARWYRGRLTATPKLVVFSDGRKAMVPLAEVMCHHGLVTERTASPGNGYGGWLSLSTLGEVHAEQLSNYLLRLPNLRWRLNPHDPLLSRLSIPVTRPEHAEIVDLRWGGVPSFAENEDFEIVLATNPDHWRAYHRLHRARRWAGAHRKDWRLLDSVYSKGSADVRLWLAVRSGTAVAGGIFLLSNAHCHLWDVAVARGSGGLDPLEAVLDAAALDARARGDVPFDLDGVADVAIAELARQRGAARVIRSGRIEADSPTTRLVRRLSALRRAAMGSSSSTAG